MKACQAVVCALATGVCVQSQVLDVNSMGGGSGPLEKNSVITFDALAGGIRLNNASGITLDNENATLVLNFAWGDLNGSADLNGAFKSLTIQGAVRTGVPQPFIYDLTPNVTQQTPTDGGLFGVTLRLVDIGSYTVAQQKADLLTSRWFLNLQTSAVAWGELRTQLTPVPEPKDYGLYAGIGLLGIAALRRTCGHGQKKS